MKPKDKPPELKEVIRNGYIGENCFFWTKDI